MEPDWELEKVWRTLFCKCSLSLSEGRLPGFKWVMHRYHFFPYILFSIYQIIHLYTLPQGKEKKTHRETTSQGQAPQGHLPSHSPWHDLVNTHFIVKYLIKSHISSSPACRSWCLQAGWPSMVPQKDWSWCFCHSTNVSCVLARELGCFVRDLVPGWNYPSHQLQPIPFNCSQNRMTEMKDGIGC